MDKAPGEHAYNQYRIMVIRPRHDMVPKAGRTAATRRRPTRTGEETAQDTVQVIQYFALDLYSGRCVFFLSLNPAAYSFRVGEIGGLSVLYWHGFVLDLCIVLQPIYRNGGCVYMMWT